MTTIVDRRKNGKGKSTGNRQKFIKRAHGQIKKAVKEAIEKRQVSDISTDDKDKNTITIPNKGIKEPFFHHGKDGNKTYVIPGNKDKIVGDTFPKPKKGQGSAGNEGTPDGDAEDEFIFTLTRDEFLDFFFEDLELPDLIKTSLKEIDEYKFKRAGYSTIGMPANLNILKSMKNALGRQIALQSPYKKELTELEEELKICNDEDRRSEILLLIEELEKKIAAVPFIDNIDIRYNVHEKQPSPTTQAVMFCLMDVSASMGEHEKELAKRFFMMLYIFLQRHYEKIEVVFIRHHNVAYECTEHEFFYGRESGGTVVSSALKEMDKIIKERYSTSDWNIYGAQASDGDNWPKDNDICIEYMEKYIMPFVQYFAYVQVGRDKEYNNIWMAAANQWGEGEKPLWNTYKGISNKYKNFAMDQIENPKDIYPVFKELFKKKE